MKKFISLAVLLSIGTLIWAQVEELDNLSFNPALYYSTKSFQPESHSHRYLIDKKNIIVTADTLKLPFVDDFSTNKLRSYRWVENHITDTFNNVFGTCLGNEGIATVTGTFSEDTAWYYSFDTVSKQLVVDSPKAPIKFTFFGPATSNCFASFPQTITYWPQYYTYTFDSSTGRRIDSILVTANTTTIDYAPVIYFADGEPGTLWFDNYAYHNYTYPVNPPTIGVATLDGLNEFGLPYNNSSTTTYGTADYLTSKPINLQGITGDDSVYLSFFYQPQGFGDYPDAPDSLIVEFKEVGGIWDAVWSSAGLFPANCLHISLYNQRTHSCSLSR